jgi:trans-AT polyketide synthase/acyltransferase/oxidoreductase domain-containing protein
MKVFEKHGAQLVKRLVVSAAFHSRYMASAQKEFESFLNGFDFAPPKIPVVANVTARPYEPDQMKSILARQITSSVQWTESIRWLIQQTNNQGEFFEIGPGNVLTGLIRRIRSS